MCYISRIMDDGVQLIIVRSKVKWRDKYLDGSGFRTRAISSSPRRHVLARRLRTQLPLAPFIAAEFNKFDNTGSSGHCRPGTIVGGGLFENAHNNTDLAVECISRTFHFPSTACPSFLSSRFLHLFADSIIRIIVCRHFNAIRGPFCLHFGSFFRDRLSNFSGYFSLEYWLSFSFSLFLITFFIKKKKRLNYGS